MLLWQALRFFLIGLVVAFAAAWWFPHAGIPGGFFRPERTAPWAVAIIFFIQGLQLPSSAVRAGLFAWPVHLFSQSWIFLGVPLIAALIAWPLRPWLPEPIWIGFFYLAFLPTTVASCAAFTAQAGGNVAASLFNICTANAIGLLSAPLLLAWLLSAQTGVAIDLLPMLARVGFGILLPFAIGQIARRRLGAWAHRQRTWLAHTNTILIFFIVYTALCQFIAHPPAVEPSTWRVTFFITLALLGAVHGLVAVLLHWLRWPIEWRIAAFYVASQKTLAAGLPIAGLVVAEMPDAPPLALLMLPLLIYHIAQLILGALLVPFWQTAGRRGVG